VLGQFLESFKGILDDLLYRHKSRSGPRTPVSNGEYQLLGLFQQFFTAAAFGIECRGADLGANINQLSLDRFFADNFGIGCDVGGAGRTGNELTDVAAPINGLDFSVCLDARKIRRWSSR
jgi:hypothetical protein